MHTTVVNPPAAAARVPVAIVSLWVWPGSRKCTWMSTRPGQATSPVASITRARFFSAAGSELTIRPFLTNRSSTASRLVAGSMTRAPLIQRERMRGKGEKDQVLK
jgi:hypothetical protein